MSVPPCQLIGFGGTAAPHYSFAELGLVAAFILSKGFSAQSRISVVPH